MCGVLRRLPAARGEPSLSDPTPPPPHRSPVTRGRSVAKYPLLHGPTGGGQLLRHWGGGDFEGGIRYSTRMRLWVGRGEVEGRRIGRRRKTSLSSLLQLQHDLSSTK